MSGKSLLVTWRDLVLSDKGPHSSARRLVLIAVAKHMNGNGTSCWPSIALLAKETQLSERCVGTHLQLAENEGWLLRETAGLGGQGWRRKSYLARFPEGTERGSARSSKGTERGSGASQKGTEPDDEKVPNEVPTRTPKEDAHLYTSLFEEFWAAYPRRNGGNPKRSAFMKWKATLSRGNAPSELLAGVRRYAAFCDATGKTGTEFVKQAATFLGRDEHWTEEWTVASQNGAGPSVADSQQVLAALEGETHG